MNNSHPARNAGGRTSADLAYRDRDLITPEAERPGVGLGEPLPAGQLRSPRWTRSRPDPDPLTAAVQAAKAGDESAFVVVWRTMHPLLLRYLRVRGDEGPEDLAAETWMHVVRGLGGFQGNAVEFRAWLFTIARHRAIDQGRARSRRPRVFSVADVAEVPDVATPAVSPSAEQHAVENHDTARALRLVASLPPLLAEMVMLRVIAGLDVADVARLLDKKPGTVRVTVHRALQALARDPRAQSAREVV